MSDFDIVDISTILKPEQMSMLQKQISATIAEAVTHVDVQATEFERLCMVAGTCFISGLIEGIMRDADYMNAIREELKKNKHLFPSSEKETEP